MNEAFLLEDREQANKMISERIHLLMWRQSRTHSDLAEVLGIPRSSVSNRLRGNIKWSAVEVAITASWLDVKIGELIPVVLAHEAEPTLVVSEQPLPEGAVLVLKRSTT